MEKNDIKKIIVITVCFLLISTGFISLTASNTTVTLNNTDYLEDERNIYSKDFLDLKISFLMKLAQFPAVSVCVIKGNEVVFSRGYGIYDLENSKQASQDTIYVIASVTKTIVGTALMQLWEQGLFELDDDVNNYLPFSLKNPNFPDDPITFKMLLSHTSSLNTNTRNEYYWMNFSEDPPFDFFPEPYLEQFLVPGGRYYHNRVWNNIYRPGERAMYANVGFDIISYLVEIISGEKFLSYCQNHIFNPLEMHSTSFNLSNLNIDDVAKPYFYYLGEYYQINELDFLWGDITPPQPYWKMRAYPAGGLYTSVNDLSHFLIAHMNDGVYKDFRLLEKDSVDLMHAIIPDNRIGYGLAWMKFDISAFHISTGHGGDLPGADTWMLYIDSEDVGVIYFANGNPAYGPRSTLSYIAVQLLLFSLFRKGGMSLLPSLNILYRPVPSFMKFNVYK
jgi:CubicO group peptidase (beta-lactamase class C family)